MKLSEYISKKEFEFGLPQGDTIIDLEFTEIEETTFKTNEGEVKPTWKLVLKSGETYNVPKSVMAAIKASSEKGANRVRVTRTGTQLATRYTVVGV